MSTDTLAYGRGTRGSHTFLLHSQKLMNRVGVVPRGDWAAILLPVAYEAPDFDAPVQSAGESQLSMRMEHYLGSALAEYTGLASDSPKQIRMTASPETRAANMDPWTVKNRRRIRLIEKKHREGLDAKESADLDRLKTEFYSHIQTVAPRSTEVLDGIDARIDALKRKAEAKREKKA